MKLLLINYEYPPIGAGAANATHFLARAFRHLGHEVVVLTAAYGEKRGEVIEEDGVRVLRVPSRRRAPDHSTLGEMASFSIKALPAALSLTRTPGFTASIAFFTLPCGPIAWLLQRQRGLPYIVSLRGGDVPGLVPELAPLHQLLTPVRRAVLRGARAIVANAAGLADLSRQADPFPVAVIPNGVDCDFFSPDSHPEEASGIVRLLFAGRFQPQKNLPELLEACARLKAAGRTFTLDLVGDGPQRLGLEAKARRLGLSSSLRFHGWVGKEDLRALYRQSHAFVNPSLYEGLPNTVLEAQACGLPVLASDIPGNRDLVEHGVTGLLFRLEEIGGLAARLSELLGLPEGTRRSLGVRAAARARQDYSWEQVARRYLDLLSSSNDPSLTARPRE